MGSIGLFVSCTAHKQPCPGVGGENIEKERLKIPVQSTEVEMKEEKA